MTALSPVNASFEPGLASLRLELEASGEVLGDLPLDRALGLAMTLGLEAGAVRERGEVLEIDLRRADSYRRAAGIGEPSGVRLRFASGRELRLSPTEAAGTALRVAAVYSLAVVAGAGRVEAALTVAPPAAGPPS